MNYLALTTFFFGLALSWPSFSQSENSPPELHLRDTALVRLGGQVFFLKDVEKLQVSYKILSCIGKNSYIERFLRASRDSLIPGPWRVNNIEKGSTLPEQLEAFILIEKLKLASISSATAKLTRFDLAALSKTCGRLDLKDLTAEDMSLFISELYLRQRFSTSKDLPKTMEEFVKSLNVQYKHELLRIRPSEVSMKLMHKKRADEDGKLSSQTKE